MRLLSLCRSCQCCPASVSVETLRPRLEGRQIKINLYSLSCFSPPLTYHMTYVELNINMYIDNQPHHDNEDSEWGLETQMHLEPQVYLFLSFFYSTNDL